MIPLLPDCVPQRLSHSCNEMDFAGLQSLNRIVAQLASDKRQAVLKRLGNLTSNIDVQIRMGASTILNKILDNFTAEQRGALADKLILCLQSSLTSLDWAVKVDGLNCLNMLFKHIPLEISKNYSILENVMDLVSSTKEDLSGRKLDMELKCSKNHIKLWGDVCDTLSKMLQYLKKTFHGDGKSRTQTCNVSPGCEKCPKHFTLFEVMRVEAVHPAKRITCFLSFRV